MSNKKIQILKESLERLTGKKIILESQDINLAKTIADKVLAKNTLTGFFGEVFKEACKEGKYITALDMFKDQLEQGENPYTNTIKQFGNDKSIATEILNFFK